MSWYKRNIFPFSFLGVTFLGALLPYQVGPRRVTPPCVKVSKEDSIKEITKYKEKLKRDSIYFAKLDSLKLLRDSLSKVRTYTYILKVTVTPDNVIFTSRNSGYQQVTLEAHYTKPQLYYQVFTSTKQMSIEEASAYADNNPDKVTILSHKQYLERYRESSIYDYYLDNLDAFWDDPENLDENPDEIFDFLLD